MFAEVNAKAAEYRRRGLRLADLGVGDAVLPLADSVISAGRRALDELSNGDSFVGYTPFEGCDFLRRAISDDYARFGANVPVEWIFVSDGIKSDMAAFLRIVGNAVALVVTPAYPAYVEINAAAGNRIVFVEGNERNGFLPHAPDVAADIVYLCSPSNPTGAVMSREYLSQWVDYAVNNDALLLFDAAYRTFNETGPRSIYEIDGAEKCAVEFNSLSKSAGFTGVRCGWTVIPDTLAAHALWRRVRAATYNGTSYVVQRMAEAVFGDEGRAQTGRQIEIYRRAAKLIKDELDARGAVYFGDAPYLWVKCPGGFERLIERYGVICTSGEGFGRGGEGFVRLSAFGAAKFLK